VAAKEGKVTDRHRCLLVFALLLLAGTVVVAGGGRGADRAAAAEACGSDTAADWLCREAGEVKVGSQAVRGGGPFPVTPRMRVWVDRAAAARVAFAQDAVCVLGGAPKPTVIVSRYHGSLFLQRNGSTTCDDLSGQEDKFGVFCRRTALCPVEVSVNGSVLTEWKGRPPSARPRLLAVIREIVLTICATEYRVSVKRKRDGGLSSGTAYGSSSSPQITVVRIEEFGTFGLGIDNESDGVPCDPGA
jgi:hypothetical protein